MNYIFKIFVIIIIAINIISIYVTIINNSISNIVHAVSSW